MRSAAPRGTVAGLESSIATTLLLPLALAVIMFGMGLSIRADDFRRVAKQPRAFAFGLLAHAVVIPLIACGVGIAFYKLFGMAPILVLGLLLTACCPPGATSNLVTFLARADAALSVSITSVNSLAAAITTPLAFLVSTRLVFGTSNFVDVSFLEMVGHVTLVIVLPVLGGMLVARAAPAFAERSQKAFKIVSTAFLAIVILGVILDNRARFAELAVATVPASLALNILALAAGLGLAYLAGVGRKQARAISIEAAFQNGTLGIAIAIGQLRSSEAAIVPGFYSLCMFATGAAVAWWWARDEKAREAASEPVGIVA
jgi:bile acid:Na+ symporter, BASS family